MSFYPARRRRNSLWMGLSVAAAGFGLSWLFLILAVLFWKGLSGISFAVFTQMTPPPGSAGGLLNAIAGSLIMTVIGVAVGTPLGMLAGTYLAEYGRYAKLAFVVRFINDILLSAPSIVIGLFIYRDRGGADGPFLGHRRGDRLGRAGGSGRGSHHRRHVEPRSQFACAKPAPRSACRVRWSFSGSAIARRGPVC